MDAERVQDGKNKGKLAATPVAAWFRMCWDHSELKETRSKEVSWIDISLPALCSSIAAQCTLLVQHCLLRNFGSSSSFVEPSLIVTAAGEQTTALGYCYI